MQQAVNVSSVWRKQESFFPVGIHAKFPWTWGQASPCLAADVRTEPACWAADVRAEPACWAMHGRADSRNERAPTLPWVVGRTRPAASSLALSRAWPQVRTLRVALLTLRSLERPMLSAVPALRAAHSGSSALPLCFGQSDLWAEATHTKPQDSEQKGRFGDVRLQFHTSEISRRILFPTLHNAFYGEGRTPRLLHAFCAVP